MSISKNFHNQRVKDIENCNESIVVIKIGYPKKTKIPVVGYYRQWSQVYNYKNCDAISIQQQEQRFEDQMKKISEVKDRETLILGDMNIYFKIINKHENDKNNYEKSFNKK